jgi:uncharacterized membrane protein
MDAVRRSWITTNLNKGMVPVNTLRDWISSAQWMGGQALLVAVGVSGYAVSAASSVHGTIAWRLDLNFLLFLKLLALVALQAFNFFSFVQAVRYYGHVSFLMNAKEVNGRPVTDELVWVFMKRATRGWSSGFRGLLSTWPLLVWVFGPVWLVLATLVLVVVLRQLDYGEVPYSHPEGCTHRQHVWDLVSIRGGP